MICYHKDIEKHDLGGGVVMQVLGVGDGMNVIHWDLEDGAEIPDHNHEQEQFGFIIKGQLDLTLNGEVSSLKAGDAYFIPPSARHSFVTVGKSEAIDLFSPMKRHFANPRIDDIIDAVIAAKNEKK